jgi:hypothetical protein
MLRIRPLVTALVIVTASCAWIAACSSDNTTNGDAGSGSSGSATGASGSTEGGAPQDAGTDAAAGLGLLVDNMTATVGTRISLQVPAGESPGSYYTYSDSYSNNLGMMTSAEGTADLLDQAIDAGIVNGDGSQIIGDLCFHGTVVTFAGLGMSLVYGNPPDASPESGISAPVPFDASHYTGVSFYIYMNPIDGGTLPTIHFGIPDTQTADIKAWPTASCEVDGGVCDDDFGSDVTFTPGVWTKVKYAWSDLGLIGFGMPVFSAINTSGLIGMKWQANGNPDLDAAAESFNFCISDIYFTP